MSKTLEQPTQCECSTPQCMGWQLPNSQEHIHIEENEVKRIDTN